MRPVSGLERPLIQWSFVAIGLLLVGIAAAEAIAIRRGRAAAVTARAAEMEARLDRQQAEIQLAHERSAREALALEAARLRGTAAQADALPPTLTLAPIERRGAAPPEPSVEAPPRQQVVELRLQLPRAVPPGLREFAVAIRTWSSGQPVWTRAGLAASTLDGRAAVTALITGDALVPGAYELLLTATTVAGQPTEVASYEVSVGKVKAEGRR